jgi:hypothetical protein
LRHKATLRRISLSNIDLSDIPEYPGRNWLHVLTRLNQELPKLRELKLRGDFFTDTLPHMSFDTTSDRGLSEATCYHDALQDFVINGGLFSMRDQTVSPEGGNPSGKTLLRAGLPHDATEPDDPVLDYAEDDFEDRICDSYGRVFDVRRWQMS